MVYVFSKVEVTEARFSFIVKPYAEALLHHSNWKICSTSHDARLSAETDSEKKKRDELIPIIERKLLKLGITAKLVVGKELRFER